MGNETIKTTRRYARIKVQRARLERETEADGRRHSVKMHKKSAQNRHFIVENRQNIARTKEKTRISACFLLILCAF